MKDHEVTIGLPLHGEVTQLVIATFDGTDKPTKLAYAILVYTGDVIEPVHATMYVVQETMNRTVAKKDWLIGPDKSSHRLTHDIDLAMDSAYKYLIHFHLKEAQKIEGYIHTCISVQ